MIKIIKEKPKNKKAKKPYYILKYDYMIGDANGDITETVDLSVENPHIEKFVTALNKLKPTTGHWGVILTSDRLKEHFNEKQITKDEYDLLMIVFKNDYDEEEEFLYEFEEGIRSENHYSFLVFTGAKLVYVDEYGEKFKTKFED